MKLRNRKIGEISNFIIEGDVIRESALYGKTYYSLAELNEEWEDYEELKEYWYIDWTPEIGVYHTRDVDSDADERQKSIGNYFKTKEEAELAVCKLKAWKRLKDKGFRFDGWDENHHNLGIIEFSFDKVKNNVWDFEKDLDLLFGGDE